MNRMSITSQIKIIDFIKKLKEEIQSQSAILTEKKQRDIITSVDKYLNNRLVPFFKRHFTYPVLSEESKLKIDFREQDNYYWIIDPLDGTLNHYRSIPMSCISVALWRKQQPVIGIVVDLNHDAAFLAVVEKNEITDKVGAWLNSSPITVSKIEKKSEAVICTGFPSNRDYDTESLLAFSQRVKEWQKVRLLGSAALSLAWVGCGRTDAYIEEDIRIWDVAAGLAIVKAAGGEFELQTGEKKNFVTVKAGNGIIPLSEI